MLFEKYLEESKKISETNEIINNLKNKEEFYFTTITFISFFVIFIMVVLFKLNPIIIIFCFFMPIRRLSLSHFIGYPILNIFISKLLFILYGLFQLFFAILLTFYVYMFGNPEFIQGLNKDLLVFIYVFTPFFLLLVILSIILFKSGVFRNKNSYSFIILTLKAKEEDIKKLKINCKEFENLILNNSKEKELAIKHILNKKNKGLSLDTGEKTLMNAILENTEEKETLLLKECLEKIGNKKENLCLENI